MKEYALFVKQNGDAELYCGGVFAFAAKHGGVASSVAGLWTTLDAAGERLVEIREMGIDDRSGEQTFMVKTLPKGVRSEPPPHNGSGVGC